MITPHAAAAHRHALIKNRRIWETKPLIREIYRDFYRLINTRIRDDLTGPVVEIGSGIGAVREVIPGCIPTDMVGDDQMARENIYRLTFADSSVSHLVLFDVFHHLRFPAAALAEAGRVVVARGRMILFEPCISALGALIYGVLHGEGLGLFKPIDTTIPPPVDPRLHTYYAAQANASRIFSGEKHRALLHGWTVVEKSRFAALSYVLSGGYRRFQFYPLQLLPMIRCLDRLADRLPSIFATRMLIVLEKNTNPT